VISQLNCLESEAYGDIAPYGLFKLHQMAQRLRRISTLLRSIYSLVRGIQGGQGGLSLWMQG